MSAFRIIGVTRGCAKAAARKEYMTGLIREDQMEARAEILYRSMRPRNLSAEYDAPVCAERYVETAKKTSELRDWHIEYRHPCGLDPKTQRLRYEWRRWNGAIPELTAAELGLT